jgi:hypothetical protein
MEFTDKYFCVETAHIRFNHNPISCLCLPNFLLHYFSENEDNTISSVSFLIFVHHSPLRLLKLPRLKENCIVLRPVTLDTQTMERPRALQVMREGKQLTPCGSCRWVRSRPRRQWPCCRSRSSGKALLGRRKIHTKNIQAQITYEHVMYTENTKVTFLVNENVA